jgi:serine/threonine protein phosphatase 1
MSTIAIGDIHGNLGALDDLLGQLAAQLNGRDTVVFLGDYIDRGSDSCGCIERILEFRSASPSAVVTLLGNHEDWLLRSVTDPTRHSWILGMEAFPTITSYSGAAAGRLRSAIEELGSRVVTERTELPYDAFIGALPDTHLEFLKELQLFHRVGNTVFVHGGLDPCVGPVEQQDKETLLWGTDEFPTTYVGPDLVVYGHHNDAILDGNGWPKPRFSTSAIGLDTISHGVLTAVGLPEGRIFQSARHDA